MTNAEEVWSRKSDDDVIQAAVSVDEYTEEGRRIILAELARRGLRAVATVPVPRDRRPLTRLYFQGWERSATFQARANRRECFTFVIANAIMVLALLLLDLFDAAMIVLIAVQLPQVAVSVRRLHDTGKSGWWTLVRLVPIAGSVLLLAMLLKEGDPAENTYGVSPG